MAHFAAHRALMARSQGSAGVIMRPATIDDVALIATLHAESWVATYRGMLPDRYLDDEVVGERHVHWKLRMPQLIDGAGVAIIAERAYAPVGFICMDVPDEHRSVYIDNLHTRPTAKGGGIGTMLLKYARQWSLDQGATSMNLLVLDSNCAAIGFYRSRGWIQVDAQQDTMGGVDVVALRYRLPLT